MSKQQMQDSRPGNPNRDTIASEAGAHPVGTGLGAVAGAVAAGAVAGSVVGPVGTVIGAALGAAAGGVVGHEVAAAIDPVAEEAYWRDNYSTRPYISSGATFDDYGPAYRYGVDSYGRYSGRTFDQAEPELRREWDRVKGTSRLAWSDAKNAAGDAWQRVSDTVERAIPGDSDHDGK